jgi:hypothetical protein
MSRHLLSTTSVSVASIAQLGHRVDGDPILRAMPGRSRWTPRRGDGADVWVNGELLSGKTLVVDGRLSAVTDFSGERGPSRL